MDPPRRSTEGAALTPTWPKPNTDSVGELLCSERHRRQGCDPSLRGAWIGQPRDDPYQVVVPENLNLLKCLTFTPCALILKHVCFGPCSSSVMRSR
jgi:hypothetical protein